MGKKFKRWQPLDPSRPASYEELISVILKNRSFQDVAKLAYGDYGLDRVIETVTRAIQDNRRIALYADYDVDGTMSCVSWIWFLQAIGYSNYVPYIPCRFKEGYGLNLKAVQHLIDDEKAEIVITMDTGITANEEAAYCRSRGVEFICTDHHKIQPDRMPDCIILNPKVHPEPMYQELCGCGITFVLLRRLAAGFPLDAEKATKLWIDLLALVGMATICDLVPLNGVNHQLAKRGVQALMKSERLVLKRLREAAAALKEVDESDVGFRLGPRINAVGRLDHADLVVQAFLDENPEELIRYMGECNVRRQKIQAQILEEARAQAETAKGLVLFLGGDWHPGVVGIAASHLAEEHWKPTWLFQRKEGLCKGSARAIPGFDVTEAMVSAKSHFQKFGGHRFAGGFSFQEDQESRIRGLLEGHAERLREKQPDLWESRLEFDCELKPELTALSLADHLTELRPFGHGFEEPRFVLESEVSGVEFYQDKVTGKPKHTAVTVSGCGRAARQKIMFFNEVHREFRDLKRARFVVAASRNLFRGQASLSLRGVDFDPV
jgi:single-stranded-DNA-specific exonuclease